MSESDTSSLPPPPPPLPHADYHQPHGSKGKGAPFEGRIQLPIRRPSTNSSRSQGSAVSGRSSLPINHPSNNSSPVLMTRNNQWNPSSEPSTPPITDTFEPIFGAQRQKWRTWLVATLTIIALILAAIFGFYLAGQRQNFLKYFHEYHHDQNTTSTNSTLLIGSELNEMANMTDTPQQTETSNPGGVPENNVEGPTPAVMLIPKAPTLPKLQDDLHHAMMEGDHQTIKQLKRASPGDLTDEEIAELIARGEPIPEPYSSEEKEKSEEVGDSSLNSKPAEETPPIPSGPAEPPAPVESPENPTENGPIESDDSVPEPPETPLDDVIPEPDEKSTELSQQPPPSPEVPQIPIEEEIPESAESVGESQPPELPENPTEEGVPEPAIPEQPEEGVPPEIPYTPDVVEPVRDIPADIPPIPQEGPSEEDVLEAAKSEEQPVEARSSEIEGNLADGTEPAEAPPSNESLGNPSGDILPEPAEPEIKPLEIPAEEDVNKSVELEEQQEEVPAYLPPVSPTEELFSEPIDRVEVAPEHTQVPEILTDTLPEPAEPAELPMEELNLSPEVPEISSEEVFSEPGEIQEGPVETSTEVQEDQIADIQEEIPPIVEVQERLAKDVPEILEDGFEEPGPIRDYSVKDEHPIEGTEEPPAIFREYPTDEIQEQPVGKVEKQPVEVQEYPSEAISGQPIEQEYPTMYDPEQPIQMQEYPSEVISKQPIEEQKYPTCDVEEQPVQLEERFSGFVPELPIKVQEYPAGYIPEQPIEVQEYPSEVNPEQLTEVQEHPGEVIEKQPVQLEERFSGFVPELQEYPIGYVPQQPSEVQEYPSEVLPERPIEVHQYPSKINPEQLVEVYPTGAIEEQPIEVQEDPIGDFPEQPVEVPKYPTEEIYREAEIPVEVAPLIPEVTPGEEIPTQPSGLATSYFISDLNGPGQIVKLVEGNPVYTPDIVPPYVIEISPNIPEDNLVYQTDEIGSNPIEELIELKSPVDTLSTIEEPTGVIEESAVPYPGDTLVDEIALPVADLSYYPEVVAQRTNFNNPVFNPEVLQESIPVYPDEVGREEPIDVFETHPELEGLSVPVESPLFGEISPFSGQTVLPVGSENFIPLGFIPDIDASSFPEGPLPVDDSQEFDLGYLTSENSLEEPGTVIQNYPEFPGEPGVDAGSYGRPSLFDTEITPLEIAAGKLSEGFDGSLNEDDELITAGQRRSAAYRGPLQAVDRASSAVKEVPLSLFPSRVLSKFDVQENLPVLIPHGGLHNQIPTKGPSSLFIPEGTIATPAVILENLPQIIQQSLIQPGVSSPVSSIPLQINPPTAQTPVIETIQHPLAYSSVYGAPLIHPPDQPPQVSYPKTEIPILSNNGQLLPQYPHPARIISPIPPRELPHPVPNPYQFLSPVYTPRQIPHPVSTPHQIPPSIFNSHQTLHPISTSQQIPHPVTTPHQTPHSDPTPHQIPNPVPNPHEKPHPVAPSHQVPHPVSNSHEKSAPVALPNQIPHPVPNSHQKPHPVAPPHQFYESVLPSYQPQAIPSAVQNQHSDHVPFIHDPHLVSNPYQKYSYPYQHQTWAPFSQPQNISSYYNARPAHKEPPSPASRRELAVPKHRPQRPVLPKTVDNYNVRSTAYKEPSPPSRQELSVPKHQPQHPVLPKTVDNYNVRSPSHKEPSPASRRELSEPKHRPHGPVSPRTAPTKTISIQHQPAVSVKPISHQNKTINSNNLVNVYNPITQHTPSSKHDSPFILNSKPAPVPNHPLQPVHPIQSVYRPIPFPTRQIPYNPSASNGIQPVSSIYPRVKYIPELKSAKAANNIDTNHEHKSAPVAPAKVEQPVTNPNPQPVQVNVAPPKSHREVEIVQKPTPVENLPTKSKSEHVPLVYPPKPNYVKAAPKPQVQPKPQIPAVTAKTSRQIHVDFKPIPTNHVKNDAPVKYVKQSLSANTTVVRPPSQIVDKPGQAPSAVSSNPVTNQSKKVTPVSHFPVKYFAQPRFVQSPATSRIIPRVSTFNIAEQPAAFQPVQPQYYQNPAIPLFQIKTPPQPVNTTVIPEPQILGKPKFQAPATTVTSESTKQTPVTNVPFRNLFQSPSIQSPASSPVKGEMISKVPVRYGAEPLPLQFNQLQSESLQSPSLPLPEVNPSHPPRKPIVPNKVVSQLQPNILHSTVSVPNDKPTVTLSRTPSNPVKKLLKSVPSKTTTVDKPAKVETLLPVPTEKLDYHFPLKYLAQPFSVPSPLNYEVKPLAVEQADRPLPFSAPSQYMPLIFAKHINTLKNVDKSLPAKVATNAKPAYPIPYAAENLKTVEPVPKPWKFVSRPLLNEHPKNQILEKPHVPTLQAIEVPKTTPVVPVSPVEVISKPLPTEVPKQSIQTPVPFVTSQPAESVSKSVETFWRPMPSVEYLNVPYKWNDVPPVSFSSNVPNVPIPLAYMDRNFYPRISIPSPLGTPVTPPSVLSNFLQSIPYTWVRPILTVAIQDQWPDARLF